MGVETTDMEFEVNTKLKMGHGIAKDLPKFTKKYESPYLVIDKNVSETPYGEKIIKNFKHVLYYDFGEPTYNLLDEYRFDCWYDSVIAVGGGSVIDFAKGLAFLSQNNSPAITYKGFPETYTLPLDVIAVPTTAGTGSEVTYNASFIDTSVKKKLGINVRENTPVLAILDPKLIESCPSSVIASSGMDALTHAIESYCAKQSNIITKFISTKAYQLITNGLEEMNYINLQLGAYFAGIALMNSGSGPAGAMSYVLGANFNIPHGLAGALFLPHIIRHNNMNNYWYEDLFIIRIPGNTVERICKKYNIDYTSLSQCGVDESNVNVLLDGVEELQPAFDQNPVPFAVDDAKNIINRMVN